MPLVLKNAVPEPHDFLHPQKLQMHGVFFVYLSAPHDASKLQRRWGPGALKRTLVLWMRLVGGLDWPLGVLLTCTPRWVLSEDPLRVQAPAPVIGHHPCKMTVLQTGDPVITGTLLFGQLLTRGDSVCTPPNSEVNSSFGLKVRFLEAVSLKTVD